jgi:hypothetical protein
MPSNDAEPIKAMCMYANKKPLNLSENWKERMGR